MLCLDLSPLGSFSGGAGLAGTGLRSNLLGGIQPTGSGILGTTGMGLGLGRTGTGLSLGRSCILGTQ